MRNAQKTIFGNIDRVDDNSVSGWAISKEGFVPEVRLYISDVELNVSAVRTHRPDVANIYGDFAEQSGFEIDLKFIRASDKKFGMRFAPTLRIEADGVKLLPSRNAQLSRSFRYTRRSRSLTQVVATLKRPTTIVKAVSYVFRAFDVDNGLPKDEKKKYYQDPNRLATKFGRRLTSICDNTKKIKLSSILCFVVARNEYDRLPYFLDYYRRLGVDHFLFVDNGSTDATRDFIAAQPDCSMWYTEDSYKDSNFGIHWTNYLLNKYGLSHWCLTADPDEFFVYPHYESRSLRELTEYLYSNGQEQVFCVLLDMYSGDRVSNTVYCPGQDPLSVAPYFDKCGYTQRANASYGDTFIQGGPRRRVFFNDQPSRAPAINKTPLVYWRKQNNYISSTHLLAPKEANVPHKDRLLSTTACLLHFKFFAVMAQKAVEEIERKEHYENSVEYRQYHSIISDARDTLFYDKSLRFQSSRQLCDLGFMTYGRWF